MFTFFPSIILIPLRGAESSLPEISKIGDGCCTLDVESVAMAVV